MTTEPSPRVQRQLGLHAGHKPWGENDGSLRATLRGWGLTPDLFLESLESWGYEIVIAEPDQPPDPHQRIPHRCPEDCPSFI